jgi:uncharacterized membrane protein
MTNSKTMQKIATRIFMYASLIFGVVGIAMVLTLPESDNDPSILTMVLRKILMTTVFVILSSFALSVAGKYLSDKKEH